MNDRSINWQFFSFGSLADASLEHWQRLNELHLDSHPALDGQFMGLLLQHFGGGDELIAIGKENDRILAGAVIKNKGRGIWTLFLPGQGCVSPLIFEKGDGLRVVRSLQRAIPGQCWLLKMPKIDPAIQSICEHDINPYLEIAEYGTTFAISLADEFETYWSARSKGLKQNIRRIIRKVDASGLEYSLSMECGRNSVADGVLIHGEIENSGWKGEKGSAIGAGGQQDYFYRDLLQSFSTRYHAYTFLLRFDGQPVASLLCIASGRTMITLKTAYREQFAKLSPGRLIDYLVFQQSLPFPDYDWMEMYTRASVSDLSWASNHRSILDIDVFRYPWIRYVAFFYHKLRDMKNRIGKSQTSASV